MAERANLLKLAERCEAASGQLRGLDYLIFCAQVPVGEKAYWNPDDPKYHFTASIDAALSLVPEGFLYMVANVYDKKGKPCLGKSTAFICPLDNIAGSEPVNATTPALALTAACLRARATENTNAPDA